MENDNPVVNPDNVPYNGDDYPQNPWQPLINSWLFHQNDNFVNGGVLYQNLNPGEAQYSEWSQQMVSTMYQNWYNSAPEQIKRAMEAGINPFVAASGIAGSGAGSVASAPNPSNTSGLPNLIGSAAQGLSAVGGAFGNIAAGVATLSKLRHEINKIDQDTASAFHQMGFTRLQSKALGVQLKYLDQKEQIGVWQALASFDKTKQEYSNLRSTHRNIIAQFDEIIARKDLLIAQQGEVKAKEILDKALADKARAEANWQDLENKFFVAHGYKLGTPIFEALRDQMVNDGTFDMESFGDIVSGYEGKVQYAVSSAQYNADEETAYNRAHNTAKGQYDADPYQESYRKAYDEVDKLYNMQNECTDILTRLKIAHDEGRISDEEYNLHSKETRELLRSIQKSANELEKSIARMSYSVGHASKLDDIQKNLVKIGVPFKKFKK